MRANKKQIQKKVNRPKIVLFTLFIFVKKQKKSSHKYSGPHLKKNFCLFLPFSEISVMGALSGALGYQVGESGKILFSFLVLT